MKSLPLATAFAVAGSLAYAGETKTYDFDGFDSLRASAGVTVIVTEGADFSVQAEAIRGNLNRLEIEQSGDTLVIGRENSWGPLGIGKRDKFEITVTLPELTDAHASSGSTMTIAGVGKGDLNLRASSGATLSYQGSVHGDLDVDASSGASLTAIGVMVDELEAEASSGASMHLDGTCQDIDAAASSGASLNAREVVCQTGDAKASGGASLNVHVTEELKAKGSGGASLRIYGQPQVTSTSTGGASVSVN